MFDITILQSLVGKTVRLYRGESESRRGILLAVKTDYLELLTEDSQIIYCYLPPLTSVEEDFGYPSFKIKKGIPQEVVEANIFQQLLGLLVNQRVRIDQIGDDYHTGLIRFVGTDYVVLQTNKETFIYYQSSEIRSISKLERSLDHCKEDGDDHKKIGTTSPLDQFLDAPSFASSLAALRYTFVRIHLAHHETISGILTQADQNQVVLVHNKEVIWISRAMIVSVTTTTDDVFPVANEKALQQGNREIVRLRLKKHGKHKRKTITPAPPIVRANPNGSTNPKRNTTKKVTIKVKGTSNRRGK
ncbi:hypothetical protein EEL30_17915 [Brevibacillus laterosporus]|uniref:DUF2642 domain-containing protein n=1 Tax=Brevibacillus laterosporus TaxID=1465 RepID=A0A518VAH6_BRELA|nr:hypothetical protein EEL30_17915 [Brevibacillus laterosporus]